MALSFKHWFLTLLLLPEVTYPLNYEFLRTGRYTTTTCAIVLFVSSWMHLIGNGQLCIELKRRVRLIFHHVSTHLYVEFSEKYSVHILFLVFIILQSIKIIIELHFIWCIVILYLIKCAYYLIRS